MIKVKEKKRWYFMMPTTYFKTKTFADFAGSREAALYWHLYAWVIKAPINTGGLQLYNRYYKKGKLVCRWSVDDLAKFLGVGKSAISKQLRKLEERGLIKIHKLQSPHTKNLVNVYELGEVDENGRESLYFHKVFNAAEAQDRKERAERALIERFGYDPDDFK